MARAAIRVRETRLGSLLRSALHGVPVLDGPGGLLFKFMLRFEGPIWLAQQFASEKLVWAAYFARRFTAYPYWMGQAGSSSSSCCALRAQYGSRSNSRPRNSSGQPTSLGASRRTRTGWARRAPLQVHAAL